MFTKNFSDMAPALRRLFSEKFGERARFDEILAPYLAYRVGGPADVLVFPRNEEELSWLSATAKEYGLPITVVGTGTNLLVQDGGIRGIVLSLAQAFQEIEIVPNEDGQHPDKVWVRCGGGVEKPRFLNWSIERNLSGLVFSSGVPGTLGGGIFMNAGTKYGCYGDILRRLRLFDFTNGGRELKREDTHFGYRHQSAVGNNLVVWATFELTRGDGSILKAEMERIIAERAEKQPLDFPSCGSTFKNPPEGLSAGRLIERSGLKGTRVGNAEISLKHANFILNKGGATASDILALIGIIKERVFREFGTRLECEVIILGESAREGQVPHQA